MGGGGGGGKELGWVARREAWDCSFPGRVWGAKQAGREQRREGELHSLAQFSSLVPACGIENPKSVVLSCLEHRARLISTWPRGAAATSPSTSYLAASCPHIWPWHAAVLGPSCWPPGRAPWDGATPPPKRHFGSPRPQHHISWDCLCTSAKSSQNNLSEHHGEM